MELQPVIPLWVGFDQREAAVYHVFQQSVIEQASQPVFFGPLHGPMLDNFDGQQDGTNKFIYSRYLIPALMGFKGWAIYVDGDMLIKDDIAKLWDLRDETKAVQVVKHDYKTTHRVKFIGTPMECKNEHYPKKNWSSVILWNCGHPDNRILSKDFVSEAGGRFLHRFEWLNEDEVGEIPKEWNHLVGEYPDGEAKLYHYTLGAPGFFNYLQKSFGWHDTLLRTIEMSGEDPADMVRRSNKYADV